MMGHKGEGGLVLVQDPKTAKYDGMPTSAVATIRLALPVAGSRYLPVRPWRKMMVPSRSTTAQDGAWRASSSFSVISAMLISRGFLKNRELEAFSYTVSHDLKAPLRSIEGFTKAILEDYAERLDETGRDYLMRVHSASQRMTQLIEAMLNMARLTRGAIQERTVDLSSLAQVTAHEIRKQAPGRQVEFIIQKNVKAKGDQDMLQVMLENLLDNAWKFTSAHPTAKIEFGTTNMDGKTVYFVRDDGAGFEMAFSDKLFKPFKRLHAESEFPGIGIGLVIAQRIVMRHNGRLWVESAPEKGAL